MPSREEPCAIPQSQGVGDGPGSRTPEWSPRAPQLASGVKPPTIAPYAVGGVRRKAWDRDAAPLVEHQEPGGSISGLMSAAVSTVPMRGSADGRRMLTKAVSDNMPCSTPKAAPRPPADVVNDADGCVIGRRELLAERAKCSRCPIVSARAMVGQRRGEEKGKIHPREP